MSKAHEYLEPRRPGKVLAHRAFASEGLSLKYPEEGELRSRTVVSRSRAHSTGKFPSWKMPRMVQWESTNERAVALLLDAAPEIAKFTEQPLTIYYTLDGEAFRHYPDFSVEWRSGERELWEVKPAAQAALPEVIARTRHLQRVLPAVGFEYRVIIAEDVTTGPELGNALKLLRLGRMPVSSADRERIRRLLLSTSSVSWGSARRGDLGPLGQCVLARLTLEGDLTFDRAAEIGDTTKFMWAMRRRNRQ